MPQKRETSLICWYNITQNLKVSERIAPITAAIGSITLDGINPAILNSFCDTNMVSTTVKASPCFVLPAEENNHTGVGVMFLAAH